MKYYFTLTLLIIYSSIFSQDSKKESWSVGFGLSNFTMQGDLRSLGTGLSNGADDNNAFNIGGYLYVNKMFTPVFGLELKANYQKMAGAAQEVSGYSVQGTTIPLNRTNFKGTAYGAELSTIINFSTMASNPYRTKTRKWNVAGYLGIGIQTYDSELFDITTGNSLVDFGDSPSDDGKANSVYYSAGLGLKYKLSKKLDIELRPTVNLNEEDHLDAAISSKQNLEIFFKTNLGLVFKFNSKEHDNFIWHDDFTPKIEEKEEQADIEALVDAAVIARLKNYPKIDLERDTDKDGFVDYKDNCPLRYSKTNNGCPGDRDNDGVPDDLDLCPDTPGEKYNYGCKKAADKFALVNKNSTPVREHIYFNLDSALLTEKAKEELNSIVIYMLDNPKAHFSLFGNADKGGSETYNQDLSKRRANATKKYLVVKGINPDNLKVIANGENLPKFQDDELNGLNRRVDIVLIN